MVKGRGPDMGWTGTHKLLSVLMETCLLCYVHWVGKPNSGGYFPFNGKNRRREKIGLIIPLEYMYRIMNRFCVWGILFNFIEWEIPLQNRHYEPTVGTESMMAWATTHVTHFPEPAVA